MFGVRIWLTPMHNTNSPAASLRLAWFSPMASDMGALLSATFGHQVYDKPQRSQKRSRRLLHLTKPTRLVKPEGTAVCSPDRQVSASRTQVPHRSEPALHQPPPDAATAQARYKVDVQMRGIKLGNYARRAARMMDAVAHIFVVGPS